MSVDEVIEIKDRTYSKELINIANKILKQRKSKVLKALEQIE